jgi:hypothetical protein
MDKTEVVRASELYRVLWRIFELRYPDAMPKYRKELARYERRLGKREEITRTVGDFFSRRNVRGFVVKLYDDDHFIQRPEPPRPTAWVHFSYDRSMGFTTHASQSGFLADPRYNREIRPTRVGEYVEVMKAGSWRDLLSDPIAVTADGHVLNGQHRLAAAADVKWDEVENDPTFLVVWGVDPKEALYADGSRRTAQDEKTIATKLVA